MPLQGPIAANADAFFWQDDLFIKLGQFNGLHDNAPHCARMSRRLSHASVEIGAHSIGNQLTMVETGAGAVNGLQLPAASKIMCPLHASDGCVVPYRVDIDFNRIGHAVVRPRWRRFGPSGRSTRAAKAERYRQPPPPSRRALLDAVVANICHGDIVTARAWCGWSVVVILALVRTRATRLGPLVELT